MKVYIATRFDCWRNASRARDQLLLAGHVVTSRWIDVARELDGVCEAVPIGDPRRAANAQMDLDDLSEAEAILVLVPISGGTGMWLELGYALGTGKRVVMAGPARERTIFADLSDVKVFEEVYDAIAAFGGGDA